MNLPRTSLLGIDFADISLAETLSWLLARSPAAPFAYAVTPNADHLQRLRRLPALWPVYDTAALRLFDSHCLAHAAAALGLAAPQVVTGADLVAALLPRLAGMRVAVVGMSAAALAALAARHPAVTFHHHAPPMALLHNPAAFRAARDFVLETAAPVTLFALGAPVQELLAYAVARAPNATGLGLCVGAALDFAAGVTPRAPCWMRQAGLEWLHRLNQEPLRLAPRYLLGCPPVLLALAAAAWRKNAAVARESGLA